MPAEAPPGCEPRGGLWNLLPYVPPFTHKIKNLFSSGHHARDYAKKILNTLSIILYFIPSRRHLHASRSAHR